MPVEGDLSLLLAGTGSALEGTTIIKQDITNLNLKQ